MRGSGVSSSPEIQKNIVFTSLTVEDVMHVLKWPMKAA